jgi:type III secretion system YscQ/HrcQ family protein
MAATMPAPGRAAPYPWEALDALSRTAIGQAAAVRRRMERALRPDAVCTALSELLSADVDLVLRRVHGANSDLALPAARVSLAVADGSAHIDLALEPALASTLLAQVLARPVVLEPPDAPLSPALSGALAALLVEVARRSAAAQPLHVRANWAHRPAAHTAIIEATLLVQSRPYQVAARIDAPLLPTAEPSHPVSLHRLGPLPITARIVGGIGLATRAELEQLHPGDAWLCGAGWLLDASGAGRCALAAPTSSRGAAADLASNGDLVLREGTVELPLDAQTGETMTSSDEAMTDAIVDAPIVVRVEVGAVSMSAREWASLAPGDVILAGRRIADPVILRVAGREVAYGELVNVEGELGVRIQHIEQGD